MAIEYHFRADNHALSYIMALVNGFSSASFTDIAMVVAKTTYSSLWDGSGASYCCSAGVVGIPHCIMAVSCIYTLLGATFSIKTAK